MTKKAIFFDCDGTLLNTLEDIHAALNMTLTDLGYPSVTLAQTQTYVGNGLKNLIRNALGQEDVDDALARFHFHYAKHLIVKTHPYDGVLELIDELKSRGLILGMISNKTDHYIQQLAHHFFQGKLDIILGERDNFPRKPDVAMLQSACDTLNISFDDVIFIGDSRVDAQFIQQCQVVGGLFTYGFDDKEVLLKTGLPCFDDVNACRRWILSQLSD